MQSTYTLLSSIMITCLDMSLEEGRKRAGRRKICNKMTMYKLQIRCCMAVILSFLDAAT